MKVNFEVAIAALAVTVAIVSAASSTIAAAAAAVAFHLWNVKEDFVRKFFHAVSLHRIFSFARRNIDQDVTI